MSDEGTNNEELHCKSNVAGREDTPELTGGNEAEPRGKSACKSNKITSTPMRGRALAITPNAKKASKREQSLAKKSRKMRKKGLLEYFGDGPRVQGPSTKGALIKAVKNRREKNGRDSNLTKKKDSSKQNKAIGRKKSKSDDKELVVHKVDLEKMEKMPLKVKGKKDSMKKAKKKNKKGKSNTPKSGGRKKATFNKTAEQDTVEEKEIKYKSCVVGFAVRVDKGKDKKGAFDKEIIKGLTFMQMYINQNASFYPIWLDKILKPIKEKCNLPKYQVTMRNFFCVPNPRPFNNVNANGGRVIKGPAIVGFTDTPQQCLNDAAGISE
jgi:hypothetical protein